MVVVDQSMHYIYDIKIEIEYIRIECVHFMVSSGFQIRHWKHFVRSGRDLKSLKKYLFPVEKCVVRDFCFVIHFSIGNRHFWAHLC